MQTSIPGLDFDPDLHVYRYEGVIVPGVSDIMAPIVDFGGVPRDVLRRAADRGSKAHLATELWDLEDLDEESLAPALVPFLEAHIRFRRESGFAPEHIEQTIWHPRYRYAGTADRFGRLGRWRAVLDYKTGREGARLTPKVGVQLAAYQVARNEYVPPRERINLRLGVMLRADSTYEMQRYEDRADWPCFLSLLNLYRWKESHNV